MKRENILKTATGVLILVFLGGCSHSKSRSESGGGDESRQAKSNSNSNSNSELSLAPESSQNSAKGDVNQEARSQGKRTSLGESPQNEGGLSEAIKNQRDQEIFQAASQVLLDNPNDLKALNAMALYNYKKGRFLAAEYLLKKGIAQHSSAGELHSNLGLVYLADKKKREAMGEFRKALEINPEDPVAAANLGSIFVEEKDYAKGNVALEIIARKGWKDPKALVNYAITLTASGKYIEAEGIYLSLLKDQVSGKEVLFNLAILQIEHLKKYTEGLETINRLKFVGAPGDKRKRLSALEVKARAGK